MNTKYFKNGNINIKFEPDELKEMQHAIDAGAYSDITAVIYYLMDLDFILADNCEGCAGNYHMYYAMYNAFTGYEYTPLDADFYKALQGYTLKLYGHKITDAELKEYYAEYYGE
jgi:roadblock/LC7 domain-containing protein